MTTELQLIESLLNELNIPTKKGRATLSIYGRVAYALENSSTLTQTTAQDDLAKIERHLLKIHLSPNEFYCVRLDSGAIAELHKAKARAAVRVAEMEDGK